MSIPIRRVALNAIAAHAVAELPDECCGLLVADGGVIVQAVRARSLRRSPTAYLIDPKDQFDAIREARASAREVVGAYHSHPDSDPVPSARDLAEAQYPEYVYVIVRPLSDGGSDIRAYRLDAGNFAPVGLVTVP
jgi:proteasome lid subunit RPN8/RPN11